MIKYNEKRMEYFEIRSIDDNHGLEGTFEDAAKALEFINQAYVRAKERGYDNKRDEWLIVCVRISKKFCNGGFISEDKSRFVFETAAYSDYEEKFVFVA